MSPTLAFAGRLQLKSTMKQRQRRKVRIIANLGEVEHRTLTGDVYFVYRFLMQDENLNDFVHDATFNEMHRGYGPGTVPLARADVGDWLEVERTVYRGYVLMKWRRAKKSK